MIKILYIILFSLIVANCSFNKVLKKHGVRNLELKQENFVYGVTNINDIRKQLGPPSTKSTFDNDIWIYIEREITSEPLIKLGGNKIITNNVLVLEIDQKGLLMSKNFIDINKMNELDFNQENTEGNFTKKSFVYNFLSSMRQKINDPLGKRKKP